jgi:hypothetical protein
MGLNLHVNSTTNIYTISCKVQNEKVTQDISLDTAKSVGVVCGSFQDSGLGVSFAGSNTTLRSLWTCSNKAWVMGSNLHVNSRKKIYIYTHTHTHTYI